MIDWKKFYESESTFKEFTPEADAGVLWRMKLVDRLLRCVEYSTALDVGCGDGILLSKLKQAGAESAAGLDISVGRLKRTGEIIQPGLLVNGDAEKLPFKNDSFDLVTATETVEHLPDAEAGLKEMARVAKKYLLITVPNRDKITKIVCPHCDEEFFLDGHLHTFSSTYFRKNKLNGMKLVRMETSYLMKRPGVHWKALLFLLRRFYPERVLSRGQFLGVLFKKV